MFLPTYLPLIHRTESFAFDSSHDVLCRGHFPTAEESVTRVCGAGNVSARARVKESPLCKLLLGRNRKEGVRMRAAISAEVQRARDR